MNFALALADAIDPAGTADAHARAEAETDWNTWLTRLFPTYVAAGFAPHHHTLWDWAWGLQPGQAPDDDLVAVWNRGGAKSTSAELAVAACGARGTRRYVLYVCRTQDLADDHVTNIGAMLESAGFGELYPEVGDRLVGKYGDSKGWRVNRLRTRSGFTVDAVGLDTAARGVKLDEERPDLIVLDDVDHPEDTARTIAKNKRTITHGLLPAGAEHAACLAIQNLIRDDGIFADLAGLTPDGPTFLTRRILSGPIPAVDGLEVAYDGDGYRIVRGEPTWAGYGIDACERFIAKWGLTSFLAECQHDVSAPPGGLFDHLEFDRVDSDDVPDLVRVAVAVDPAVTSTDDSDACGVHADGLAPDGTVYRLWSWEQRSTPVDVLTTAAIVALELGADTVLIETNQGGDTWHSVWNEAVDRLLADDDFHEYRGRELPRVEHVTAPSTAPKVERAARMVAAYELGWFTHVRDDCAPILEPALRRFPKTKPLDLVDAAYWSARELRPELDALARRKRRTLVEAA